MFKPWVLILCVFALAAPRPAVDELHAAADFPLAGNYTENKPCVEADKNAVRVKITADEIESTVMGLCMIRGRKRDGNHFFLHVECQGAGGAPMIGDVSFTIKPDNTLDFADQDNTYKAVLHKCPD